MMQADNITFGALEKKILLKIYSWMPIFIGGLIALGLGYLLGLFAKEIELSLYTNDLSEAATSSISRFFALILGAIVTMYIAGFAAGFFAGPTRSSKKNLGVAYAFVTWCLSLILLGLFSTQIGRMLNAPLSTYYYTTKEIKSLHNTGIKLHRITEKQPTVSKISSGATGAINLAIFFTFLIGALSANFGVYSGFYCWEKERCIN